MSTVPRNFRYCPYSYSAQDLSIQLYKIVSPNHGARSRLPDSGLFHVRCHARHIARHEWPGALFFSNWPWNAPRLEALCHCNLSVFILVQIYWRVQIRVRSGGFHCCAVLLPIDDAVLIGVHLLKRRHVRDGARFPVGF